jgi:CBS domain-containing protein
VVIHGRSAPCRFEERPRGDDVRPYKLLPGHMSLVQLTCADLVPKWQVLVTLKATDTIQEALEELRDRHFRSFPVISSDGRPVGFVDVLDLVAYLVSVFPKPRLTSAVGTDISQLIEGEDLETFWQEAQFRMTTLQDANVISKYRKFCVLNQGSFILIAVCSLKFFSLILIFPDMSKHNPWVQLPRSTSLARAIGVFATGVHHIALTDESGKLASVLSQMDVVRFMNTDAVALLGSDAFSSLKQLGLSGSESKRIKCVRSNTPAIDAFCAMQRHGVSSVAVVNDNWQLMVCFSLFFPSRPTPSSDLSPSFSSSILCSSSFLPFTSFRATCLPLTLPFSPPFVLSILFTA